MKAFLFLHTDSSYGHGLTASVFGKEMLPSYSAYSFQATLRLSKVQRKFGDKVLIFHLGCCYRQLALSPVVTCQPLTSLAAKCTRFSATLLLPLETRRQSCLWQHRAGES